MTLKIRSRSQGPNQFSFINKCYIHADFSSNLLSCSGDIIRALACPSVTFMQILVKIKLLVQEILSIISLFGLN